MTAVQDDIALPAGRQAASAARRALVSALGEHVDSRTLADAQVVVTELIGLVLPHPDDERTLHLTVSLDSKRLRVAVAAPGDEAERRDLAAPAHNLAIVLVDHLADRWSVDGRNGAWFELAVEPSDQLGVRRGS